MCWLIHLKLSTFNNRWFLIFGSETTLSNQVSHSYLLKFPQEAKFAYTKDWQFAEFLPRDVDMILQALWRIANIYYNDFAKVGIDISPAHKNFVIEFTSNIGHPELRRWNAIGVALLKTPNYNLNY